MSPDKLYIIWELQSYYQDKDYFEIFFTFTVGLSRETAADSVIITENVLWLSTEDDDVLWINVYAVTT